MIVVLLLCYALTIVGANYLIQTYGIVPVGFGLMAPAGVYAAGLAFGVRVIHADAIERHQVDGWPAGDVVYYRCPDCGHAFSLELPQ